MFILSFITVAENENILKIEPLETRLKNDTYNSKTELLTKETDSKVSTDVKKKSLVDLKSKVEQKYQKSYKEDETRTTTSTASVLSLRDNAESKSSIKKEITAIPILFPPSTMKIPQVTETSSILTEEETTEKTTLGSKIKEESRITELTSLSSSSLSSLPSSSSPSSSSSSSSRGRALNVTAAEPANSLHTNLTDLSDVSMDEDDKKVE
ncbi:hypothetical protein M0802_015827, partial [Mischocyttarus mexicanus]